MANRAYLYPADEFAPDQWEVEEQLQYLRGPYFDSRGNIPLAWLFFFVSENVYLVDARGDTEPGVPELWQEVKFVALKQDALATFAVNEPLLMNIIGDRPEAATMVQHLKDHVAQWSGNYLILDPREILEGEPQGDGAFYREFLNHVRDRNVTAAEIATAYKARAEEHVPFPRISYNNIKDFRMAIFGITYWQ